MNKVEYRLLITMSISGVCPPNTEGEMCEKCVINSWHYDPYEGCQICECNSEGSKGADCELRSGNCTCLEKYTGRKCDSCQLGFFNFPTCEQCGCSKLGSQPASCRENDCACEETGQCRCKENVDKLKCTECKANSFGLEESNPKGCTKCFCFHRQHHGNSTETPFCIQSSLVWQQVKDGLQLFKDD